MTAGTLNVHRLVRAKGPVEEVLAFEPGVNVIVGEPNTGKDDVAAYSGLSLWG